MQLTGIAIREKSRAPMRVIDAAKVTLEEGVIGDFRGKPGKRQVTVLSESQWGDACNELQVALPWTYRRANLLVSGVNFSADMVGKHIVIGDLILQITRETDPCPRMDEQHQGLTGALTPQWRGGVCCKVISEGEINLGQHVEID